MHVASVCSIFMVAIGVVTQLPGLEPNFTTSSNLSIYNPVEQSFTPNGPWSLMSAIPISPTTSLLSVSGMCGFHPSNSSLVVLGDGYPRVRQAFQNMADLVELAGGDLVSCVRLTVYVSDMYRWRPIVNDITREFWHGHVEGDVIDGNRYCPRSIVEVQRLNEDDIVEVEGTFWVTIL